MHKMSDTQYLIMNPKLKSMLGGIEHKMKRAPELGRILKDKGYDKIKEMEQDMALRVHVRTETEKKQEKLKAEELERKKLN